MGNFKLTYARPDGTFVGVVNGLPYHLTEADPLFAEAQSIHAASPVPLEPEMTAPELSMEEQREAASMTRDEFAKAAAEAGYISWPEAAQFAAGNAVPAVVQALIDSLPEDQRGPVLVDVLAMAQIKRTGKLMPAIAAAFNADDAALDALYGIGGEA